MKKVNLGYLKNELGIEELLENFSLYSQYVENCDNDDTVVYLMEPNDPVPTIPHGDECVLYWEELDMLSVVIGYNDRYIQLKETEGNHISFYGSSMLEKLLEAFIIDQPGSIRLDNVLFFNDALIAMVLGLDQYQDNIIQRLHEMEAMNED